ncbi:hypothetical protein [Erysipelothrix sp. HDW6C]|uniref:hypothetical protein n=1 Tax=Erysipelothrix sp. HDW6C TaxID=2714930 RepID=UPI00352E602E
MLDWTHYWCICCNLILHTHRICVYGLLRDCALLTVNASCLAFLYINTVLIWNDCTALCRNACIGCGNCMAFTVGIPCI